MRDKEIKQMIALAESKLKQSMTKEEALKSLQRAGILDKQGNFTAPYKTLNQAIEKKS